MIMKKLTCIAAALLLTACAEEDKTAPPPPHLEAARATTAQPSLTVSGNAEYATAISVTRTPAPAAGEELPAELRADPFTSRFSLVLPLALDGEQTDNVFTFTSTDSAGNTSEPTTLTIKRIKRAPDALYVLLPQPTVSADDRALVVVAQATHPEPEVSLAGFEIHFAAELEGSGDCAADGPSCVKQTAKTDARGVATTVLSDMKLAKAGAWSLTATSGEAAAVTSAVPFTVRGGVAASLKVLLTDGAAMPADALTVQADTTVTASLVAADGTDNPVQVPFTLYTDAPGALIVGNQITGVRRAGTYTVAAVVNGQLGPDGTPVAASATLTVTAAAPTVASIAVPATAAAGQTVTWEVLVSDAFGNKVTPTQVLLASSDPQGVITPSASDPAVGTLAHEAAGTKTLTATVAAGTTMLAPTASVEILPGPPAAVEVTLQEVPAMTPVPPGGSVTAGTALEAKVSVKDAFGNETTAPVGLSTNAPALLQGGALTVTQAGSYSIIATVGGTLLSGEIDFTVVPDVVATIAVNAQKNSSVAGQKIQLKPTAQDQYGNLVPAPLTVSSSPTFASTFTAPCSTLTFTDQGVSAAGDSFVAYDLSAISASGNTVTLTATDGTITSAAETVTILPATPARFGDSDPAANACGDLFLLASGSAPAGGQIAYTYAVVDQYGNETIGPIKTYTNAPNAQLIDDGISGAGTITNLTLAGTFTVTALIPGVGAQAIRSFSVGASAPISLSFFLNASLAGKNDVVRAFGIPRDEFSNPILCTSSNVTDFAITVSPATGGAAQGPVTCGANGAFIQDFAFPIEDTYLLTATYTPAGGSAVTSSAFVTILSQDNQPPVVTIQNVSVNAAPCSQTGSPPACEVQPGDVVIFDVVASDNVSLSALSYAAFFATAPTGSQQFQGGVLVPSGSTTYTQQFSFTVPPALPEDVNLVARAQDGSGNLQNSLATLLRVQPFNTFGRPASTVASGGFIKNPNDVAVDASGNVIIGNDGSANLLRVSAGSKSPLIFSSFNRQSNFLKFDSVGRLLVSNSGAVWRVSSSGSVVEEYVRLPFREGQGLDEVGPTRAKGLINAALALDGDTVTVAGTVYEYNDPTSTTPNCPNSGGTAVCFQLGAAACAGMTNKNQCLAATIDATNPATHVATFVNAGCGLGSTTCAVVTATNAGEGGNALQLTSSTQVRIQTSNPGAGRFAEGHLDEFFLGQDGLGDNNVYRFPEDLAGLPAALSAAHGTYDVSRQQLGISVKNNTTNTSPNLLNLRIVYIQGGAGIANGGGTLHFYDVLRNLAGQTVTPIGNVGLGGTLVDVVARPGNGCLLVSDRGNGRILAVSPTTGASSTVADGFSDPRGLAFDDTGANLYVTENALNAVIRIGADATNSCF